MPSVDTELGQEDDPRKESSVSVVTFKHRGNFNKTEKFLNFAKGAGYLNALDKYGRIGVDALASATPKDTGKTANSWDYEIVRTDTSTTISWLNTNENKGVPIAIILQYGHGTGTGGYVQGRDYINPAIRPIFDEIAEKVWVEVRNA